MLGTFANFIPLNLHYSSSGETEDGKKFKSNRHLAMAELERKPRSVLLQSSFCLTKTVNDTPLNWMDYGVLSLHRTDF